MKITFKDVGQGDSILLEWSEKAINKIIIIDCNKKDKQNPVLNHIKSICHQEIECMILSHPHSDHYSGMTEVLDYAETKGIIIRQFAHTLHFLANDYYKYLGAVEIDTEALKGLQDLIDTVDRLKKKGIIKKIGFITEGWHLDILDNVHIKCLSPGPEEARRYMDLVDMEPIANKSAATRAANYLSTVFVLTVLQKYHILTSDCEIPVLERLISQNSHTFLHRNSMAICQLPHHGSLKNHLPDFWDFITVSEKPVAVVSAGLHEKYKHPHFPVLDSFYRKGYFIKSTNIVYGMVEYAEYLKKLRVTSNKLDSFADLVSYHTGGDQSFDLN
ncbi:ComEC/Rec2 family competence protein [Flavihumibacter petaseus]|uniref:Metallo-beta-lactamase domain-containing protein n=1 Tax=Flavihumibacter petaseus NBRC 106054 TaxID=1220578 RepID=A0A0E9N385_9BACT|nr:hypothetical protein [Flavihumibacter petaseus]GAO44131.1 hypothetical protein FPE01S_03_01700 [Flavihumibacter petaseus NBRC 106054]